MRPQKDQNNKKTKRLKKEHRVPQNVIGWVNKPPFDDSTGGEVDKIP